MTRGMEMHHKRPCGERTLSKCRKSDRAWHRKFGPWRALMRKSLQEEHSIISVVERRAFIWKWCWVVLRPVSLAS
jgi:hypothetical protein